MGAYGAGTCTCQDKVSTIYYAVLVAAVLLYVTVLKLVDRCWKMPATNLDSSVPDSDLEVEAKEKQAREKKAEERLCKVLMLLAIFAVSITYVAGVNTPGGFWDSTGGSHHLGDAILKDHHNIRLTVFLFCNTMAFVASLFITMLLIIDGKNLHKKKARSRMLYGCIVVALVGLVGAYAAGSCRETDTTVYVLSLVGAVVAYILLHRFCSSASRLFSRCFSPDENEDTDENNVSAREALDKARSLVLLLATLAAAITYAAGLDPPGGLWQDNSNGHMAGDPILLTTNLARYRAFYYCNSVAFVASLVAIVLVQKEKLVKHHALEAAMILVLFGLIGAYAAGSCRDVNKSIYAMALAGAVLIYVVIHIVFFTLDHKDKKDDAREDLLLEKRRKRRCPDICRDPYCLLHAGPQGQKDDAREDLLLEKRRKRLLLFAILAATITYQAGLPPPGGFLLQDDKLGRHHAGDPVLLDNYPRRYNAFFYCNSISFMLSIALIILLVNPNLYRPAIRSNALSVCTAVGLLCLMGAYATGSTQHLKTSIYIIVLAVVVLLVAAGLLLVFLLKRHGNSKKNPPSAPIKQKDQKGERKKHARRKYLMLLGILVASVAYQAGLKPPGGTWQSGDSGYEAGNPVMHDNRRPRYLVFFYSNSISFVASIVVIIMLLPQWLRKEQQGEWEKWSLRVMNWTIRLDLFALLGAYAAGSNRGWKTSMYVVALIIAVLGYFVIHMKISTCLERRRKKRDAEAAMGIIV
uniref:PGG domain-containing protein n=1 Tax=Aegilops tauschii TaxID=37682 RepID=M8BI22_AEGTA